METQRNAIRSLLQGNNEFETGILTVPAGGTVPEGALLARTSGGKFAVVEDAEKENPVAVNPVEIGNPASADADIPFRAIVGGRVRFDMLSVAGQPITERHGDLLRQFAGITAKKVTDLSWGFRD